MPCTKVTGESWHSKLATSAWVVANRLMAVCRWHLPPVSAWENVKKYCWHFSVDNIKVTSLN